MSGNGGGNGHHKDKDTDETLKVLKQIAQGQALMVSAIAGLSQRMSSTIREIAELVRVVKSKK